MLALEEKVRTVVLLRPELCSSSDEKGPDAEIIARFEESYLEVKARKQIYLTQVDAERFFHYLPPAERKGQVDAVTRGLSTVVVLQHLDGDAIEKTIALVEELSEAHGVGSIYCSQSRWETMRDLEFFFPSLDSLPPERTLALIKADGISRGKVDGRTLEEVVESEAAAAGLFVVARRKMALRDAEAEVVCEDLRGSPEHHGAMAVLMAEPGVVAMCLEGRGAIGKWLLLSGPTNAGTARDRAPTTLRAAWGTDGTSNALHASASAAAAERELRAFFPEGTLQVQRTLCIVKPEALHVLLQIRMDVEAAGFTVLKAKQLVLTEERAREFYRDSAERPHFAALVEAACAGPSCVMVLCRLEAVAVWQQLMGPEAVKDARQQRPGSLRARWGCEGQRNGLHGSASARSAAREVRFFFPELGADPVPEDDEVRDFLFRKSAGASMDLKSFDADSAEAAVDPTLQQLLSRGLLALCQVQPKGLAAVKWLSRWLLENSPNAAPAAGASPFAPPERTRRFVEYGVNEDGMAFAVEEPPPARRKQVIEVDVSDETEALRGADFSTPPHVVFVVGGPGSGKGTQCSRLKEDFNFVHLSTGDLMRDEIAAETYLGTEIYKHMQNGTLVPDTITLRLLKKTMLKHQDTNRFLIDGFPRTLEQAKRFEQEIAEVSFVLYFEASFETMRARIADRAVRAPGRMDDNPKTVERRLKLYEEQTLPVVRYYGPIGRLRQVSAEQGVEEVYAEAKGFFGCRFVYLLGPPGAPMSSIAERLERQYSYASIDFEALLRTYAASEEKDAAKVRQALARGRPVEASIACPLVLAEVYRDMALGVQSFVVSGFPQSLKQLEFLEYRVPCRSRPLLLELSRPDAEDLAASAPGGGAPELALRTAAFFAEEQQRLLAALPGLLRVRCSLAELQGLEAGAPSLQQQLLEAAWPAVRERLRPSATLVLGPPCSGAAALAPLLASMSPNTVAVDCSQLLDKELERRTELGAAMQSMLAQGQVVPLSTTLQLLKNVANLTGDSLVLENCPMYVDQIEHLVSEFRVDRVFYIAGSDKAVAAWREEYAKAAKGGEAKAFDECTERLEPIVQHFSRLGKLERLEVAKTPEAARLRAMVEAATVPQLAVVTGLSAKLTPEHAAAVASACGAEAALTAGRLAELAQGAPKQGAEAPQTEQLLAALREHAESRAAPLLVLDRFPSTAEEAAQLHALFGDPKVVVNVALDEEKLQEEYEEAHAEDENPLDGEALSELLAGQRAAHEEMLRVFEERCPARLVAVDGRAAAREGAALVAARLRPRAYVLVAPKGSADFSGLVADAICTARRDTARRARLTVLDAGRLHRRGGHNPGVEDALLKASFTAEAQDSLPPRLWRELYREAFAASADPAGTFLVTNFPTPCCLTSGPSVRDQFHTLESVAAFVGVLQVRLSESAYGEICSEEPEDMAAYLDYAEAVHQQVSQQYGSHQVCELVIEDCRSVEEAVGQAAASFLGFQERLES